MELQPEIYHSTKYNIDIKCYLTYAQIQNIVVTTIKLDSWAERQQNIDMLVAYYVTNIGKEEIENIGHESLITSGLMDEINTYVVNTYQIYEAIKYTESWERALNTIADKLPDLVKPLEEMIKKNGIVKK